MRARRGLLVTILASLMVIWVIPVAAEEMLEHSLIRPSPGSVLAENMSKYARFEAFDFPVRTPKSAKRRNRPSRENSGTCFNAVRKEKGELIPDISKLEFF